MGPSFIPLDQENIELSAPAGLSMLELIVNGRYRTHLEYTENEQQRPRRMLLSIQQIKQQCQCKPNEQLRLEATTINQQTEAIDDVDSFLRDHCVQLPGIPGSVVKSDGCGHRGLGGKESVAVFHSSSQQKQLTSIRVHHGSFLDGLVFRWSDGSETLIGKRGGGCSEFYMQEPGEFITGFIVRSGAWVDGLQIKTTAGRTSPWYGGQGGGMHVLEAPEGYALVGMYGSAARWMDHVGIFYQKRR